MAVLQRDHVLAASPSLVAYRQLRNLIVSGRFIAGQRLVEADLVDELGSSRMIVREALSRLMIEGLLAKEAGKSCVVREVSLAELEEILDTRIALETFAIRSAANRISESVRSRLSELMAELEAVQDSIPDFIDLQAELHHLWLESSGLHYATRFVESLSALSAQTRMKTALLPGRIEASIQEHKAIVDALIRRDPEDSERAVRSHLESVKAAIRTALT